MHSGRSFQRNMSATCIDHAEKTPYVKAHAPMRRPHFQRLREKLLLCERCHVAPESTLCLIIKCMADGVKPIE